MNAKQTAGLVVAGLGVAVMLATSSEQPADGKFLREEMEGRRRRVVTGGAANDRATSGAHEAHFAGEPSQVIRLDLSRGDINERLFVVPYGGVTVSNEKLWINAGSVLNTAAEIDPAETPVEVSMHVLFLRSNDAIRVSTRSSGDNKGDFEFPSTCTAVSVLGAGGSGNLRFGTVENGDHSPTVFRAGNSGSEFDYTARDDGHVISQWIDGKKVSEFPCEKRFQKNFITISPVQDEDCFTVISNLMIRVFAQTPKNAR